jgi:competence protein ComEC
MSVNTLAFAALVMLLVNPRSLFDIGFQMSFVAVLSILLWLPVFMGVFSERFLMEHRWVKWCWGMVAVSVAAQTGVAPLIAYYFGRFSSYFLLTNFIVIPAATLILYLSLVVLLIPRLAYLLIYIVTKLDAVLAYITTIPGASIDGLHPTLLQVSMVYVIILAVYLLLTYIPASGGYR